MISHLWQGKCAHKWRFIGKRRVFYRRTVVLIKRYVKDGVLSKWTIFKGSGSSIGILSSDIPVEFHVTWISCWKPLSGAPFSAPSVRGVTGSPPARASGSGGFGGSPRWRSCTRGWPPQWRSSKKIWGDLFHPFLKGKIINSRNGWETFIIIYYHLLSFIIIYYHLLLIDLLEIVMFQDVPYIG